MPENPKPPPQPQLDAMGLPTDEKAREVAIGRMMERLSRIDEAEAHRQQELEAKAVAVPPEPLVKIEWLKSPQKGSCQINSKAGPVAYDPKPHKTPGKPCDKGCRHGPVTQKATGRVLKPGTVELVPADHARVIVEGQYARVVEGFEHVSWTDEQMRTGIDTTHPDPSDERAWAALSHA